MIHRQVVLLRPVYPSAWAIPGPFFRRLNAPSFFASPPPPPPPPHSIDDIGVIIWFHWDLWGGAAFGRGFGGSGTSISPDGGFVSPAVRSAIDAVRRVASSDSVSTSVTESTSSMICCG